MDELLLIKECLNGKRDAQKRLYERFAPRMLGVCYRYAHSYHEAEDFLQEAFIQVYRKLNQYRHEGDLEGWVYRIVVNTSLNCLKARYRLHETLDNNIAESPDNNHVTQHSDTGNELMELVHRLPTGYRTVFNLYAIEGYSHDEIGWILGIKASTSRSQYARARSLLMSNLDAAHKISEDGRRQR